MGRGVHNQANRSSKNQHKRRCMGGKLVTGAIKQNALDRQGASNRKPAKPSPVVNYSGHLTEDARRLEPGAGILDYIYRNAKMQQPTVSSDLGQPDLEQTQKGNQLNGSPAAKRKSKAVSLLADSRPSPWLKQRSPAPLNKQFSDEIRDFIEYASPTAWEEASRQKLLTRITSSLKEIFPRCKVSLFGSYPMNLHLPGADIDLVIDGLDPREIKRSLHRLGGLLKRRAWVKRVEVIAKARVPIVKLTDTATNLQVDLCFNQSSGIKALAVTQNWLKESPELRPLAMIVKLFLKQKKASTVQFGGLGGFATICMVMSMLKNHTMIKEKAINPMENLGVLLIDFFNLYGRVIGTQGYRLEMNEPMRRVSLPDRECGPCSLHVIDPNDSGNVMTRGSHRYSSIVKEFGHALDNLKETCHQLSQLTPEQRMTKSILNSIIQSDGSFRHGDPKSVNYSNPTVAFPVPSEIIDTISSTWSSQNSSSVSRPDSLNPTVRPPKNKRTGVYYFDVSDDSSNSDVQLISSSARKRGPNRFDAESRTSRPRSSGSRPISGSRRP